MPSELAVISALAGLVLLLVAVILGQLERRSLEQTIANLRSEIDYRRKTYQTETGYRADLGRYDYQSFDGGKTWYEIDVEARSEGRVVIKGLVDQAHIDELRARNKALSRLADHVTQHGPLDLSSAHDMGLLTNAGVTVQKHS